MIDPIHNAPEGFKQFMDMTSFVAILGVLGELLPVIASLLTIVWMALRIFDWVEQRIQK